MSKRFSSWLALVVIFVTPFSPMKSWADVPEVDQRFACSIQNTTDEPLKSGSCDRFTVAMGSYEFQSCSYRRYGIDIAKTSDGLFRLNVKSANTSGFQTSRTLEIDVHLQENCASSYDKSAYVVGGLVTGNKGTELALANAKVSHSWKRSNTALLPYYCGFRSCADSVHSFQVELPEVTDFYTITLFFANSATGLTNGLSNTTAVFRNIVLRSPESFDPRKVPMFLDWKQTVSGQKCEISSSFSRQQMWDAGVREIRLFSSSGPSESIQTKGPSLGLTFSNPSNSGLGASGSIPNLSGRFRYDFSSSSVISNEFSIMSAQQVYTCKAWLTTLSGASDVVSASYKPAESFSNPIPVEQEQDTPNSWFEKSTTSAFSGSTKVLNEKQKSQVREFLNSLPEVGKVTCTAYFSHPSTQARSALARSRAKAVCDYMKKLEPLNSYIFQGKFNISKSLNGKVVMSGAQG